MFTWNLTNIFLGLQEISRKNIIKIGTDINVVKGEITVLKYTK